MEESGDGAESILMSLYFSGGKKDNIPFHKMKSSRGLLHSNVNIHNIIALHT